MSSVSFSGLASGIDTASLVKQLVAVERAGADSLTTKQSNLATQASIVGSLSSAVAALGAAVKGMDLASELRPRTATTSDAHVAVAASGTAAAGNHTIRVIDTAATQVVASRTFATSGAGVLGAGGVTITKADGSQKTVSWSGTDSLGDIAGKLGDAAAGVSASVLFDGTSYRLIVTADGSGTAGAVSFADTGDGLALSDPANVKVAPRDAQLTIDGVTVTRSKNVIDDALPGVTLTVASKHAATDPDTVVGVQLDKAALTTKLKDFVAKYNAINAALHVQLDYTGTTKGPSTLFGDATLRQLQGALGQMMSSAYGGATLGGIGISRDRSGGMTLDETKLADALAANPGAVEALFVTNGFAAKVTAMTDDYAGTGGILSSKSSSLSARKRALQTDIDRINDNADRLQTRLEAQFNRMEQALSQLQSQGNYLTKMLG